MIFASCAEPLGHLFKTRMSDARVSIITVNYNQAEVTCALLRSIQRQHYPAVEVLVVDNASRENPESLFKNQFPEIIFIRSEQNLGFAGGNNLALPFATGDFLFFVNNDAELTDNTIEILLQLFDTQPGAGIVSPLICYALDRNTDGPNAVDIIQYAGMTPIHPLTGRNQIIGNREPDHGQFPTPVPTAYAHGAAMMVPRRVLESTGPMKEAFFLYYEELDWCERIRKAGWEIWIEPRARVYHKESMTLQKLGSLKTYYLTRNRIWFMRQHFKAWQRAVFYIFWTFIAIPKNLISFALHGEWANINAFLRGIGWNIKQAYSRI